jgi:hypothetical protein
MPTPHRRLFGRVSRLFDDGASVTQTWPPLDPKNRRNYPKLSWKSTTCVSFTLDSDRPKQNRRRFNFSPLIADPVIPNFKERAPKRINGNHYTICLWDCKYGFIGLQDSLPAEDNFTLSFEERAGVRWFSLARARTITQAPPARWPPPPLPCLQPKRNQATQETQRTTCPFRC